MSCPTGSPAIGLLYLIRLAFFSSASRPSAAFSCRTTSSSCRRRCTTSCSYAVTTRSCLAIMLVVAFFFISSFRYQIVRARRLPGNSSLLGLPFGGIFITVRFSFRRALWRRSNTPPREKLSRASTRLWVTACRSSLSRRLLLLHFITTIINPRARHDLMAADVHVDVVRRVSFDPRVPVITIALCFSCRSVFLDDLNQITAVLIRCYGSTCSGSRASRVYL